MLRGTTLPDFHYETFRHIGKMSLVQYELSQKVQRYGQESLRQNNQKDTKIKTIPLKRFPVFNGA